MKGRESSFFTSHFSASPNGILRLSAIERLLEKVFEIDGVGSRVRPLLATGRPAHNCSCHGFRIQNDSRSYRRKEVAP